MTQAAGHPLGLAVPHVRRAHRTVGPLRVHARKAKSHYFLLSFRFGWDPKLYETSNSPMIKNMKKYFEQKNYILEN